MENLTEISEIKIKWYRNFGQDIFENLGTTPEAAEIIVSFATGNLQTDWKFWSNEKRAKDKPYKIRLHVISLFWTKIYKIHDFKVDDYNIILKIPAESLIIWNRDNVPF